MNTFGHLPLAWYLYGIPVVGVYLSVFITLFFCIFDGLIQAFVFAMLSLTYISTEATAEEH